MQTHKPQKPPLQLWGGIECTVNRIEDNYFDQCMKNGHHDRIEDLDLIAALGIQTLRYPVIWEKIAPNGVETADWSHTDKRIRRMQELGIEPIIGLVHHGSGPAHTSLLDENFVIGLAQFAEAVARRYPHVRYYTPVNEPLTTARFSALYGHWYPHARDDESFLTAVLIQCKAIIMAMQAIRTVNPKAILVQTEDIGKTYSSPLLMYQADFENDRRWLTLDLLNGIPVRPRLRQYISRSGISSRELDWFLENACGTDIIGVNHYITSERYIDEQYELYPSWCHGGNGVHRYADVEAVRVCEKFGNIHVLLREVWLRYHKPIAITEAHLGDSVAEQQRWLWERWTAAEECREQGIDIRAVTAWALFGSYDWNSLLTREQNFYEPGVFDVSSGKPVPTELAEMIKELAHTRTCSSQHLSSPGWWKRPERILYPLKVLPIEIAGQEQTG